MARAVDGHRGPADRHAFDAGDEGAGLGTAQPHGVVFCSRAGIAQVDVEIPAGQMKAGLGAKSSVAAAGVVAIDGLVTQGGVVDTIGVVLERLVCDRRETRAVISGD